MIDKLAFRASDEFAAALVARRSEMERFVDDTVRPWDEENPETPSLWAASNLALSADQHCVGFRDPGGEVPVGLSRNRERRALLPARGKAGQVWRDVLALFETYPQLGPVFREFGVADHVVDVERCRVNRPGMAVAPDASVWLLYGAKPADSPHLIEAKVSEFYAAAEAVEAAR